MALAGTWEGGQAESISDDILHEAGIYGERLSAEALRFELYDLESRTAALRGKVAGMKKQYDRAKKLLRFDLIMALYRLYRFFCVWDSRLSIRWCAIIKKSNLRSEIFCLEIELARWENRLRQLKQVRAAYCGQMREEWQDVGADTVHCTN